MPAPDPAGRLKELVPEIHDNSRSGHPFCKLPLIEFTIAARFQPELEKGLGHHVGQVLGAVSPESEPLERVSIHLDEIPVGIEYGDSQPGRGQQGKRCQIDRGSFRDRGDLGGFAMPHRNHRSPSLRRIDDRAQ